jgi:hypothetical protein
MKKSGWMKKCIGVLAIVLIGFQVFAQLSKPIQFREESHDFGDIQEKAGSVTHQFEFTNNLNRPVKILGVKPSCGCTTPDWTKEPIMPGKTGYVQARFDPKGRPGFFNKHLTVTTDADSNPITLSIKGTVTREGKEAITEFNGMNGSWLVKTASFNLGKIFIRDVFVGREFAIMNNGKKPVTYLDKFDGPKYIKITVEPKTLAPGERGTIKLNYNGKQRDAYGFQSDQVVLHTDDEDQPEKAFSIFATLEDYFPTLTPAEAAKSPRIQLSSLAIDFGRIRQSQAVVKELVITNNGKSPLKLNSIQSNCTCINTETKSKTLKPGETTSMKVSFNPEDRKGTQQKAITIYSNDPQGSVQRITLNAYVED